MKQVLIIFFFALNYIMLAAQPIAHHRWNNRLILIFSPDINTPSAHRQLELLQSQAVELEDRDLLIYRISPSGVEGPKGPLDVGMAKWFFEQYQINQSAFQILLIGKDGSEKLRAGQPVAPEKIFALIDTMPMRRAEMRRKKSQ